MENKSDKPPSTSYCSISKDLFSCLPGREGTEQRCSLTSHNLWITSTLFFSCFVMTKGMRLTWVYFSPLYLITRQFLNPWHDSSPGLSPQEYNKDALGWFVLISAIALEFPERSFFLVQLFFAVLSCHLCTPRGVVREIWVCSPCDVQMYLHVRCELHVYSPVHTTAAFPWNLYWVVITGSEPKDSSPSFLFMCMLFLPSPELSWIAKLGAFQRTSRARGGTSRPMWECPSCLVGVWWWWWWYFKGRKNRGLEGSQLSGCVNSWKADFSFWCIHLLEAVFILFFYCCVKVRGFFNLWMSRLWLSL